MSDSTIPYWFHNELFLLLAAGRGQKMGFKFTKIDGTTREVRATDRIVHAGGALRFFCAERGAWRAARLGNVTQVVTEEGRIVPHSEIVEALGHYK